MSGNPLINLGELSRPATVLVEKISEAVGGIFKPFQIKRIARAEAEVEKIRASTEIEIGEIHYRAFARFLNEEALKQANMEAITRKALPELNDDARPQDIQNDWVSHFFDECRLISDEEMQVLWGRVLAGEANSPGRFSRRTVSFLSSIDKSDAALFTRICGFAWEVEREMHLLVFDLEDDIYNAQGVDFDVVKHLDDIGLLSFAALTVYRVKWLPEVLRVAYHGTAVNIKSAKNADNELEVGHVLPSKVGQELASISGAQPVPGFTEFTLERWARSGLVVYSDWPRGATGAHPE